MKVSRLCVLLTVATAAQAHGQGVPFPAAPALTHLYHSAWTVRDGAPPDIAALAQSSDGFLWLGTSTGLYRYDGVRFEPFTPPPGQFLPSRNISALFAIGDGSLWIGYRFGGASRIAAGRLTSYGEADGMLPGSLHDFARDAAGVVWAATSRGLVRKAGERWIHVGKESGFAATDPTALLADKRGRLWVASTEGIFVLPLGATRFVRCACAPLGDNNAGAMREGPDGTIWGASLSNGLRRLSTPGGEMLGDTPSLGGDSAITMLVGADSSAWVATIRGLFRISLPAAIDVNGSRRASWESFPANERMSGSRVTIMLEDREGNVWTATEGGLDRFRHTRLGVIPLPASTIGPSLVFGADHDLWLGDLERPPIHIRAGVARSVASPPDVQCLYRDPDGSVWFGAMGSLWNARGGVPARIPLPPAAAGRPIQGIARDRSGRLWVSVVGLGVFHRDGDVWFPFAAVPALAGIPAITVSADEVGRIWLGYTGNRLASVDGDSVRAYGAADGLAVGNVMAIVGRHGRLWVGGESGVEWLHGRRFSPLLTRTEGLLGASGIVETAAGELWINGAEGISRISGEDVVSAIRDSAYRVAFERFDYLDGLEGIASQIRPLPTAIEGPDARIWFTTSRGVMWIDPHHVRRNPLPPHVVINSIRAGDTTYSSASVTLPKRTTAHADQLHGAEPQHSRAGPLSLPAGR